MDEKKYKELLEEIKGLRHEISRLTRRLELYEHLFRRYGFPPFPPLDNKESEIRLKNWRDYIKGTSIEKEIEYIKETFKEYKITPQDATLFYR
ncbi:hypothetical protein KKP97_00450 [Methanothermococcus sp. SCGC AD-155-C09]|nr:hypothetical protein [Methanothermococcus sp. SCGC AD-155-C09]